MTKEWIDLKETAELLERSIYRIRQMYWAGEFERTKKNGRKIYVERAEVEEIVRKRKRRATNYEKLKKRRELSRTIKAITTVLPLIADDPELSEVTTKSGLTNVADVVTSRLLERKSTFATELAELTS